MSELSGYFFGVHQPNSAIRKCARVQLIKNGKKIIGTRRVDKQKPDCVRSRLVAQEFNNQKVDDVFSPTPTSTSLRCTMVVAMNEDLEAQSGDFSVAFLHDRIPKGEKIYVEPPPEAGLGDDWIWELEGAMYGLRKAPLYLSLIHI